MVKNLLSLLARRGLAAAVLVATAIPPLVSLAGAEENDARVEALLGGMTLAEKIGQLNLMPNEPGFRYDAVENGLVGAVIGFTNAGEVSAVEAAGGGAPPWRGGRGGGGGGGGPPPPPPSPGGGGLSPGPRDFSPAPPPQPPQ